MRARIFIEQPDQHPREIRAGISDRVFERQGSGDDLAAGIYWAYRSIAETEFPPRFGEEERVQH